ncbi:MAG: acyl-CoA dehydrogenase family protein, partial [Acidobacteriota bacterium]|nr:acyl-CoA dehydrogenase family protein [Acidobacteriota bacterium]
MVIEVDYLSRARDLQDLVRGGADEAEAERRVADRVVAAFCDAGLYKIAAPRAIGGGETDPETQIRVIEAIARADGATGWTLMIGVENVGILGSALDPELARRLYADPALVVAGALNPLGRAVGEGDGFRISGRWPFASGCDAAQYFWGQCIVEQDGERAHEEDGRVRLIECVVPRAEFTIADTWRVSGLRGSGSHDIEIDDVWVPSSHV